jgi:glyoxylase-like metal-dependent hydrolase (beta-lactamase superfamily II)
MDRRQFLVFSSAALAAGALRDAVFAQQAPAPAAAPPQPVFLPVRRNVGTFTLRGGTIGYLINREAVVVVDTQYADSAPTCVTGLKERSSNRPIDLVINTHHHGDHTGGNGVFKDVSKKIVAHSRVPELMKLAAAAQPNAAAAVLPGATFDNTWSERMGDETVTARHYGPGHTGGDAVVFFERANVVHMGDLLFYEIHPRVDRQAGASIQNWMKSLETIAREHASDTRFIAGHARPGAAVVHDRAALLQLRGYFDAALTYVRRGIAGKKSKDEIVALPALPGFEAYQSLGTVLTLAGLLTAAYEELTA